MSFPRKKCFIPTSFISSYFFQNTCDVCMYLCRYTNGEGGRGKNLSVSKSFPKCLSPDGWSYGASNEGSAPVAGRKPRVCSGPRLDRHSQAVCKYKLCLSVQEGICTKLFSWIFLYFLLVITYSMIYSWLKIALPVVESWVAYALSGSFCFLFRSRSSSSQVDLYCWFKLLNQSHLGKYNKSSSVTEPVTWWGCTAAPQAHKVLLVISPQYFFMPHFQSREH